MAEPMTPTLGDGPSPEYADMKRRFVIGLMLTLPVVVLEMGGHLFGLDRLIGQQMSNWLQMLLATPVVLWAGWPFLRARLGLGNEPPSQHVHPDCHGNGLAWAHSMVATLVPSLFPMAFQTVH